MKKKLLSILLCLSLCTGLLCLFPVAADSASVSTEKDYVAEARRQTVYLDGTTITYSIPEFLFDTPEAKEINQEIQNTYAANFTAATASGASKWNVSLSISYTAYLSRDIISVVITKTGSASVTTTNYKAYCFNVTTGKQAENEEIAQSVGTDMDAVKVSLSHSIEDKYAYIRANPSGIKPSTIEQQFNKSVSDDNLSKAQLFLDGDGMLKAAYGYYWVAGSGYVNTTDFIDFIQISSDSTISAIRLGSTQTIAVGVYVDGAIYENTSRISMVISNPDVVEIQQIYTNKKHKVFVLRGCHPGFTNISISDEHTGLVKQRVFTVYDSEATSFHVSKPPVNKIYEKDSFLTNVYDFNGLYVDKYEATQNKDGSANVSFSVYNERNSYGAVEVFDSTGKRKDVCIISPNTGMATSIHESAYQNLALLESLFRGYFATYRMFGATVETPVEVNVPRNGCIKISNDPANSDLVLLLNTVDLILNVASMVDAANATEAAADQSNINKQLVKEALKEEFADDIIANKNSMAKDFVANLAQSHSFTKEGFNAFYHSLLTTLSDYDLYESMIDSALTSVSSRFVGFLAANGAPTAVVLHALFTYSECINLFCKYNDFCWSTYSGHISILNYGGSLIKTPSAVAVELPVSTPDNYEIAVQAFMIQPDATTMANLRKEAQKEGKGNISYSNVYNITYLKNGEPAQPDAPVQVYLPVPSYLQEIAEQGKLVIYRINDDGSLTEMKPKYKDGYVYFTTNHFSVYALLFFENGSILGDVNEDGVVNVNDATLIQQFIAEFRSPTETQKNAADVTQDNTVNISDATQIQRFTAEFIDSFLK